MYVTATELIFTKITPGKLFFVKNLIYRIL